MRVRLGGVALLLVLSLAGCGGDDPDAGITTGVTADEILIGSSAALSGHASFLGTQYLRGSRACIAEINARGGIHGRRIRLLSYDDAYDPPRTVANTMKLITDDEVFMLFDYVGTPTSVRVVDAIHEHRIPTLGFFTGAEPLRTPFRAQMFHLRASYYAEVEAAVKFFAQTLGKTKIAIMYQDDAFGLAVLAGAQFAARRQNLRLVATDTYARGSLELDPAVATMKASGAEAILLVGTYAPLARFIKLCHEAGTRPYFHTVSFVGSEAFGRELERQAVELSEYERILVTQVVPSPLADDHPAVRAYRAAAQEHFPDDEPNYVALEGYLNARLLEAALERAGRGLTRQRLISALEALKGLDLGIGKRVTFGALDHQGLEDVYFSRLHKDGTFRIFQP